MRLLPVAALGLWTAAVAAQAPGMAPEPPGISLLQAPAPDYPEAERSAGHQGEVVLRLRLARAGTVEGVEIARSSGFAALDQAALEAAKNWKFAPLPAAAGGTVTVERPVRFTLGVADKSPASRSAGTALSRPAMESLLRQPCARVNDEVKAYRREHPAGKLADMQSFRASAGMLFMDSYALPMAARLKLFGALQKAWPLVLEKCAADPAAVYGQVMKDALAVAQAGTAAAK